MGGRACEGSLKKYIGEKSFEIHGRKDVGNICEESNGKYMGGNSWEGNVKHFGGKLLNIHGLEVL